MKKFLLLSLFITAILSQSLAQRSGEAVLRAGVGVSPSFYPGSPQIIVPPVSASIDFGVNNDFSFGAMLMFSGAKFKDGNSSVSNIYFTPALRLNYHFIQDRAFTLYGGIAMGLNWRFPDFNVVGNGAFDRPSRIAYGLYAGGDLYITRRVGVFGELGWGLSILRAGISLKLK